jgi:hypothetical protein
MFRNLLGREYAVLIVMPCQVVPHMARSLQSMATMSAVRHPGGPRALCSFVPNLISSR